LAGTDFSFSLTWGVIMYRSYADSSRKYQEIGRLTTENNRWAIVLYT